MASSCRIVRLLTPSSTYFRSCPTNFTLHRFSPPSVFFPRHRSFSISTCRTLSASIHRMATTSYWDAVNHRRTYYQLSDESVLPDEKILEIVKDAIKTAPSSFNAQTTRALVLLGTEHKKLWNEVTKPAVKAVAPAEAWAASEQRLSGFAAAYGTVLWFEDQKAVEALQKQIPLYADRFPTWSEHTSAIHQYITWTGLEAAGYGANLQHYNPLIDEGVQKLWGVPAEWHLKAQLVFGKPTGQPGEKKVNPVDERVLVHGGKFGSK